MQHEDIRGIDGATELGFKEFENIPLYKSMVEKADNVKDEVEKELKAEDFLYTKQIECPVCFRKVDVVMLRHNNANKIVKDDADFFKEYSMINPLFYEVVLCNNCGYAALKSYFKTVYPKQRKLIKEKISAKWTPREYPNIYDLDIAIQRFKLALISCVTKGAKSGEIASVCLRLGWLYRIKQDSEHETYYLQQALYGFKEAIETESNSVNGMDDIMLTYLIGELSRRVGDLDKASVYFSKILLDKTVKPTLKEKARNQRDLIKQELEKSEVHDEIPIETDENKANDGPSSIDNAEKDSTEKKKFFFF